MSCPDCFRGGEAKGDPKGSISTVYGFKTYVASPPADSTSKSTIFFICDAFGLNLVNNKLLADDFALRTGMRVLVPDIIPGGGISTAVLGFMDGVMAPVNTFDIIGQLKRIYYGIRTVVLFIPFMLRAGPPKGYSDVLNYARSIKADLPPGGKLGVAGYCWGGYGSTNLCAQPSVEGGTERLIDAHFCAHPSALKGPEQVVAAITTFKTPYSLAHAGNDFNWTTAKMDIAEAELKQKVGSGDGENGAHYEFVTYKDCAHGFAARARPGNKADMEGADAAKEQAINWYKRWL
jgi:dienelactone hydrolase